MHIWKNIEKELTYVRFDISGEKADLYFDINSQVFISIHMEKRSRDQKTPLTMSNWKWYCGHLNL